MYETVTAREVEGGDGVNTGSWHRGHLARWKGEGSTSEVKVYVRGDGQVTLGTDLIVNVDVDSPG